MTPRLIDLLCERHQMLVVDTRAWPEQQGSCQHCNHDDDSFVTLPDLPLLRTLAVHEAGHAVVHLTQGTPVDSVELTGLRGSVQIGGDGTQWLEGVLAGPGAVTMLAERHGLTAPADVVDAVWTGLFDFQMLYEQGCGEEIERFISPADRLVAEHWRAIERVADAVLARGTLTGSEIAELAGCGVS